MKKKIKTEQLSIRFSKPELEKLEKLAEKWFCDKAEVIRILLRQIDL
jgi:hypothetical protein